MRDFLNLSRALLTVDRALLAVYRALMFMLWLSCLCYQAVLQCVAVCCSVLQCVVVCCSVLQWLIPVAVCYNGSLLLQWFAPSLHAHTCTHNSNVPGRRTSSLHPRIKMHTARGPA